MPIIVATDYQADILLMTKDIGLPVESVHFRFARFLEAEVSGREGDRQSPHNCKTTQIVNDRVLMSILELDSNISVECVRHLVNDEGF